MVDGRGPGTQEERTSSTVKRVAQPGMLVPTLETKLTFLDRDQFDLSGMGLARSRRPLEPAG